MAESLIFFIAGLAVGVCVGGWFIGQWVFNQVADEATEAMEKIARRVIMHGFDRDYLRNAVNKSGFFSWKSDQDKPERYG